MRKITHPSRDWFMPDDFTDYTFIEWYRDAVDNIDAACTPVAEFGVVVQAGGHAGVWPWLLAKRFNAVLTFEPDEANRECATVNLEECTNVQLFPTLLGERIDETVPWHLASDSVAHRVTSQSSHTKEMITIDSLDLPRCDLICLDVEGYEPFVLNGAQMTIAKYRPVIMVEFLGNEISHELPAFVIHEILTALYYAPAGASHYDRVYKSMLPDGSGGMVGAISLG